MHLQFAFNDYTYHDDAVKRADSRYLHRGAFSWQDAEKRNDPAQWQGEVYGRLAALVRARRDNSIFDAQADVWTFDTGSDHVLGIGRYYKGEKLLALFNFGDQTQHIALDGEYADLLHEGKRAVGSAELPSGGFAWLIHEQ